MKKLTKTRGSIKHDIAVLLENGTIYNNMQKVFLSKADDEIVPSKLMVIDKGHKTFDIPGQIIKVSKDQQNNKWFDILTKDEEDQIRLFTLYYDTLFEVSEGLEQELDGKFLENYIYYRNNKHCSYILPIRGFVHYHSIRQRCCTLQNGNWKTTSDYRRGGNLPLIIS